MSILTSGPSKVKVKVRIRQDINQRPSENSPKSPRKRKIRKTSNRIPTLDKVNKQHTTDTHDEPNWVKLRSITQERALDEFLSTAELAGTEFTAGNSPEKADVGKTI